MKSFGTFRGAEAGYILVAVLIGFLMTVTNKTQGYLVSSLDNFT